MENKWQEYYRESRYGEGKMPNDEIGKQEYELLGRVREKVTVHFPKSKRGDAHTDTLEVHLITCNIPQGHISVDVLASNLRLWTERGFDIEY